MRQCLALSLAVWLLLSACASVVQSSQAAGTQPLAPAEVAAIWRETDAFIPRDTPLTDGEGLYFSLRDVAALLDIDEQQGVLLTSSGRLELDGEAGEATLSGRPLQDYGFQVWEGVIYLPLAQTATIVGAWHSFDDRTQTLYTGARAGNEYDGVTLASKARGAQFLYYIGGAWQADTARGVNMGLTLPGQNTSERAIPYETYLEWFGQIAQMNANVLRVYSRQPPAFYQALRDHNQRVSTPLWLYQGVWVEQGDALDEQAAAEVLRSAQRLVDYIHGQSGEQESYTADVSPWLAGWVVGSEWTADYINVTNEAPAKPHRGEYLYTRPGAPAFETRLCAIADGLAAYQTENYGCQAPIAFVNWPTTDTLEHPSEVNPAEDAASLDTELIVPTERFLPGLFALYHVYPTYPEFIAQEAENEGYAEYLVRLYQSHTVPAMVGEYGASSSRGLSHRGQDGWYSQGGLTEAEQGEQNAAMTRAIFGAGFGGAILFAWQDEWFKDVWNTRGQTLPQRNPYWYNVQNSEQSYGLLGAFPGVERPPVYLDGSMDEWTEDLLVGDFDHGQLYVTWDEGFLYVMLRFADGFEAGRGVLLPVSIAADTGISRYGGAHFAQKIQFLVELVSPQDARLLVCASYDVFALEHGKEGALEDERFHRVLQYLRGAYTRPDTSQEVPRDVVETGRLRAGTTIPGAVAYDSLADFCWQGNCLELRLPWMLIGFMDPSTLSVMAPPRQGEAVSSTLLEQLALGFGGADMEQIPMTACELQPWGDEVRYHLRLKKSYYIMGQVFSEYARQM